MEHNLRINNITRFVEDQYKNWVKQVKLIQESQRRTVMVEMGQQIHLLIRAFQMELTDFITGVTRLMDHHLSPLLVQPKALEEAFNKIKNAAKLRKHASPCLRMPESYFQVPTSTFVDDNGKFLPLRIFLCMPGTY